MGENSFAGPASASRDTPHSMWWKAWLVIKVLQVRVRFIAVLVGVGVLLVYWDTLMAFYDKWRRPSLAAAAAAADYEFWCPMHPNIIRDHPDKCPLCFMPLSKRKKDDAQEGEALPPGVVRRVQLSPYKVAAAGIQTAPVSYQQLFKEIRTVGFVEFDERKLYRINCRLPGQTRIDRLFVNFTGATVKDGDHLAHLYNPELVVTVQNLVDAQKGGNRDLEHSARDRLMLWGITPAQIDDIVQSAKAVTYLTIRAPLKDPPNGHNYYHVIRKYQVEGDYLKEGDPLYDLADLSTVWIESQVYEEDIALMKVGMPVTATTKVFPNRVFTGKVAFIHPHLDKQSRTLKVRFDMENPHHELRPGMYAVTRLKVPLTQLDAFSRRFKEEWRYRLAADGLVQPLTLEGSAGTLLQMGVSLALMKRNYALAVPESSVIDTGNHKYVYRMEDPKTFDGVEVALGPRSGAFYPLVSGLQPGERVATAGSFLIDAETRLTAGAASTYYGASGGRKSERRSASTVRPSTSDDEDATVNAALAKLSPADRLLATAQRLCPVLDSRLGAMGVPVKVSVLGESVFLCCKGCIQEARAHAEKVVAKVRALRDKVQK